MRKRPKEFVWLASVLGALALGLPLQVAWQYQYGPEQWAEIMTSLAPLNWVLLAVATFCAGLSLRASSWLKWMMPLFISLLLWNNWVVGATGINGSPAFAVAGAVVGALPALLLLSDSARKVMSNPRVRWWLTPERRRVRVEVAVHPIANVAEDWDTGWDIVRGATFDVSEGGAYIASGGEQKLGPGARCRVRLALDPFHVIHCGAEVVRRSEQAHGDYPPGFAVKFTSLDPWQREVLALYVKRALPELSA